MKFERPVGAAADVKELQFVCALHQTADDENWMDGSIEPRDVVYFLRSRYGIYTDKNEVKNVIFKGLAGGDGDDDCLDIMEMVAVLIIPLLLTVSDKTTLREKTVGDFPSRRAYDEYVRIQEKHKALNPPDRIIGDVHRNILIDSECVDETTGEVLPPKITPALIRKIFGVYDEVELIANDELVNEMVALASGGDPDAVLNEEAFARALTDDVKLYDPNNESKISTRFYDVFGTDTRSNDYRKEKDEKEGKTDVNHVETRNTLGQIDFTADNIRSYIHVICVWVVIITSFVSYVQRKGENLAVCSATDEFGCQIANSVVLWFQVMASLVILGTIVGTSLSFGNSILSRSIFGPILGLLADGLFVFFPLFYRFDAVWFSTEWQAGDVIDDCLKWIIFACGIFLAIIQIQNLVALIVPWEIIAQNDILASLLLGSSMKATFRMKQAASIKINKLVKNAYDLHEQDAETNERKDIQKNLMTKSGTKSTQEIALLNFTKVAEKTEPYGGLFWGWKEYLSGDLQSEEGIWLHSRLIAGNAAQFLVCFVLMGIFISYATSADGAIATVNSIFEPQDYSMANEVCRPQINTTECAFPFAPYFYTGAALCLMNDVPPACSSPEVVKTINERSLVYKDYCTKANYWFEGLVDSPSSLDFLQGDYCFDFITEAKDFMKEQFSDENVTAYQNCIGYDQCMLNVNSTTFCKKLSSVDCSAIKEEVENQLIDLGMSIFFNKTTEDFTFCFDAWGWIISFYKTMNFCAGYSIYEPYDVTLASVANTTSTCETPVYYCLSGWERNFFNTNLTICIMGINPVNMLPFQWSGAGCADDPKVGPMMEFYQNNIGSTLQTAEDFVPERWVIRLTASVAIICSVFTSISMAMVYIPSTIHTVLKFRSGVIPSLMDPYFITYRKALHLTTFMVGAMFWGHVATTFAVAVLIAGAVFLLTWHVTAPILLSFSSEIVGIAVTMGLKILLCMVVGQATFSGLYRKRPVFSNLFSFALECWHIPLTALSLVIRLGKFLGATGMYLGRIDRPIFQKDLMLDLDSYPKAFRQDILLAEAHHHPYLERLGLMYMMKLRYGNQFSTTAGATWRLLFVIALMPWLRTYRIQEENFDLQCDELQDKLMPSKMMNEKKELQRETPSDEDEEPANEKGEPVNENEEEKQEEPAEDPGFYQVKE